MKDFTVAEITCFDPVLLNDLKELEVRNLGSDAAINQWVIPVIIRYGKFMVVRRTGDSRIAGVCQVLRSFDECKKAFIHSFYVDKGFRRKGIGKLLLEKMLEILQSCGFESVELTVDPSNTAAVRLYSSSGFKKAGSRKDEYGRGIDRYLMRFEIKENFY
ncbi:MAG: GNAT family N-acetyltransferase [Actinobacteria bacterium]|nr:GNAT family N-acetyltransferase [Actinomycetota bacterium]